MGVGDEQERLVKKGLAEGLNDDEIQELLVDHGVASDESTNVLSEVKKSIRSGGQTARESLTSKAPHTKQDSETQSSNTGPDSKTRATDDDFTSLDPVEDTDSDSDRGIFSRLTGLFSSSGSDPGKLDTAKDNPPETRSNESSSEPTSEEQSQTLEEAAEKHDWDEDALTDLANEAINKGLAEREILRLFVDHGVPERFTKELLERLKESIDTVDGEGDSTEGDTNTEQGTNSSKPESPDEGDHGRTDEEETRDSRDQAQQIKPEEASKSSESFEDVFEEDPEQISDGSDKIDVSEPEDHRVSEQPSKEATDDSGSTASQDTDELDEETLQAMVQHGIAKGFNRKELLDFFADHDIDEARAKKAISSVNPSHQNTQGRKKSEHEGNTATAEQKDAVAVQKQDQVTGGKEDDTFMGGMDKSQENLKVGRVYLTGRKPSYGRMRVKGLQDITKKDFESGERQGFIDLSDTEEHIGSDNKQATDSGQVGDDRIRSS